MKVTRKLSLLLVLILLPFSLLFGAMWWWKGGRDIPTQRMTNLPYSGRLSTGETVVWDTQDCVWTFKETGQIVSVVGPSNDMELWRLCMKERKARRPTVSFEPIMKDVP